MLDLITLFVKEFGLLPLYAVIITYIGFSAPTFGALFMSLSIVCGVYITMFKAFNLKAQIGIIDFTQYMPVSEDIGNLIIAVLFVYMIGLTAYGLKRVFVSQDS